MNLKRYPRLHTKTSMWHGMQELKSPLEDCSAAKPPGNPSTDSEISFATEEWSLKGSWNLTRALLRKPIKRFEAGAGRGRYDLYLPIVPWYKYLSITPWVKFVTGSSLTLGAVPLSYKGYNIQRTPERSRVQKLLWNIYDSDNAPLLHF